MSSGQNWTISEKSLTTLGTLTASMARELLGLSDAMGLYVERLKEIARDAEMPPSLIERVEITRQDDVSMIVTISSRALLDGTGLISLVAEWKERDEQG